MIDSKYIEQVKLLLRLLPAIARIPEFALHGGTAINLFHHDMPRLSVDIDLTYVPIHARSTDLTLIKKHLKSLSAELVKRIPDLRIENPGYTGAEYKLFCFLGKSMVKVEVYTVIRGVIDQPEVRELTEAAQTLFEFYLEMKIVPESQLFGGKIVAALDRQHPRDLFDTWKMLDTKGLSTDIMKGFLFCLLNSNRPIHEILNPVISDQQSALEHHFTGMASEPFSYEMYEMTRESLINLVNRHLSVEDKEMLIGFAEGCPVGKAKEWSHFPGVQWKLLNIEKLKQNNPQKFNHQLTLLKELFFHKTSSPE
jgi:predicted nucleotidyltransferase component of viral defense system